MGLSPVWGHRMGSTGLPMILKSPDPSPKPTQGTSTLPSASSKAKPPSCLILLHAEIGDARILRCHIFSKVEKK